MTYAGIVTEIRHLSLQERLALLSLLTRLLQEELSQAVRHPTATTLRGVAKPTHDPLLATDDPRNEYTKYLIKKYSAFSHSVPQ